MTPNMDRFYFSNTKVLIADTLPASSNITRQTLFDLGVRNFTITKSVDETRTHLEKDNFDIMISDAYLMDEGTAPIVSDLRQGNLGKDPFMPIIALTWEPTIEILQELGSAGIDQMLTLPISANKISLSLRTLIERRKLFVVTSRYIGPDRHKADHPDSQQVPRIKVPNALRYRVTGNDDGISPDDVLQTVRDQRIERYAYRIVYTIGKIAGRISDKNAGTMKTWLTDLHTTTVELTNRITGTRYQQHHVLCATLLEVAERNLDNDSPDSSEVETLQQLALSVQVGFTPEPTLTIDSAQDISVTVPSYATA